ncbi:MAG: Serine/threonine-protein kinase AfsK [Verrucomicrobiota bacterium]|jgi:outer membrane protein assembly factor BamB
MNPALQAHCLAAFLGAVAVLSATPEWPEWRGPGGQGHAASGVRPPIRWSETESVAWKTAIPGRGWSSPVIDGKRIWLTTAHETPAKPEDAKRRLAANTADQPLVLLEKVDLHAVCVDRDSGRIVRDLRLFSEREPQWVHELNSYASPTPVLGPGRAYFHFGTFGTACVDTRSGKILWSNRDLRIMHENGPGSSPILWKNLLIFHLDGSDTQSVVALDTADGRVVWRSPRSGEMSNNPQLKKSYATPAIVKIAGREQLVSQGADWLYGYDPATGRELWKTRYGQTGFSLSSRAVFGNGMAYLSTGFMKPEIQAIQLDAQPQPLQRWKYSKGAPTMPSLLLVGDELYFVSDSGGFFTCLDARTGVERFRERLGGNHNASPWYAGGHIYLPSREGSVQVIEPGRQFRAIATNTVSGKIMATPAVVGRSLFLRTDRALYRIESSTR